MEKFNGIVQMDDLKNKLNEIIDLINRSYSVVDYSGTLANLKNEMNGWYKWNGSINNISGNWLINKRTSSSINMYSATNISDTRVVFNSTDLSKWYSPYGSWHV